MTSTRPASHIESLDGLRGLACLAVVMHHCYVEAGQYQWPLRLPRLYTYGALGVEVFFILSAFCLSYPIYRKFDQPTDWKRYARKRIWRILPPYYAAVIILLSLNFAFRHWHFHPFDTINLSPDTHNQYLQAVFLIGTQINASFWTLCLEARWYFVLPLFIGLQRRMGLGAVMAIAWLANILCFLLFIRGGRRNEQILFITSQLPFFLPLFAAGMGIAWMFTHEERRSKIYLMLQKHAVWGLVISVCILLMVLPADVYTHMRYDYRRVLPGGVATCFLLILATSNPLVIRLLTWRPIQKLGLISYSLYLIHTPIIEYCYAYTKQFHWPEYVQLFFYQLLMPPILIAIAYVFFLLFERHVVTPTGSRNVSRG